ncbi:MAG: glycosyltransferase [Rubrobacter sp.]|nr:glycosyltransferase [Rubrobacter sp.]
MPKVYSSAKLVIDDTASPTLPYGAVNSRVFDALAAGTPVVTNCRAGVRELFDEEFPTYGDRKELRAQLDRLLADDEYRERLGARYKKMVLEEHTYGKRAGQLAELLRRRAEAPGFCIKIGAPDREVAESWGDTHYARAVRRQLEANGYPCKIQTLDEWDGFEGLTGDVALHLKGLTPYTTKPGQLNVLWNISHPEELTARECDRYDVAFVASRRWARSLEEQTDTPVYPLRQATDPRVFYPDYDPAHDRELVFVGNSRRVERRILRDLLPTSRDLAVWGGDWEGLIDERHVVGEYLPNEEVRKAYSSAAIVLNDHWDDMREHGFVSNRIYDALACGALVISDRLEELEEEFGEAVVTYEGADELRELVDYYLEHPEERKARGERGRELVLERHTFEHRVGELLGRLPEPRQTGPALPVKAAGLTSGGDPRR